MPVIAIWDDHEFANDAWSGGAENHTPGTEGAWATRMAAAKQAYFEWMPVRPSTEGTTYRRLRFGTLADLHLLDLRSFRSQQATVGNGAVDDPDRTITGRAQLDWLKSGLTGSDTTWQLVGNSVMISPVAFGALPAEVLAPLAELLGLPKEGLAINTDQWDGYTDDRRELLAHLTGNGIGNTVFLTGDIHMAWANDVPVKAGDLSARPALGRHRVRGHVGDLRQPRRPLRRPRAHHRLPGRGPAIQAANRHVKWLDIDDHGYGVLDVTAERAQMDYYVLEDRTDPASGARWTASWATDAGSQRVRPVESPVAGA